jgi:hypothetical protein
LKVLLSLSKWHPKSLILSQKSSQKCYEQVLIFQQSGKKWVKVAESGKILIIFDLILVKPNNDKPYRRI